MVVNQDTVPIYVSKDHSNFERLLYVDFCAFVLYYLLCLSGVRIPIEPPSVTGFKVIIGAFRTRGVPDIRRI